MKNHNDDDDHNDYDDYIYAGFWIRTLASIIDSIPIGIIAFPILYWFYSNAFLDLSFRDLYIVIVAPQNFDSTKAFLESSPAKVFLETEISLFEFSSSEVLYDEASDILTIKVTAGIMDFVIAWILLAFLIVPFWIYHQATPGKMAISAKIVDAQTGQKPSTGQCIGRYFAYIPSILCFGLGIFWVGFDERKQGWHDKLAGTVVIRKMTPASVNFD